MKTRIYFSALLTLSAMAANAQTSYDVARLMEEDLNGTARYVGMGGAMGAFGSDVSVISKNPAGIGTFVNNDVNVSFSGSASCTSMRNPGIAFEGTPSATAYYSDGDKSDLRMALDNASFVLTLPTYSEYGLKNVNFAFAYRRVADTERILSYHDDFQEPDSKNVVFRDFEDNQQNRINQFDFNLSFNHNDRFYWGITTGVVTSLYRSDGHFYDYYPKQEGFNSPTDYNSVDRMNDFNARGWNIGLGVILRPRAGGLRFGLSFKSPTYYRVNQYYSDYLYAEWGSDYTIDDKGNKIVPDKYSTNTSYRFVSPLSVNVSAGYSWNTSAIGLEYEFNAAGLANMKIANQTLKNQCGYKDFKSYSVLRVGYETNISKLSLRCGYNYTFPVFKEDAYKNIGNYVQGEDQEYKFKGTTEFNQNRFDREFENPKGRHTISVGAGYCSAPNSEGSQFYVDAAFVYNISNSDFNVGEYSVNDAYHRRVDDRPVDPTVGYQTRRGKLLLTLGWTF
ncbi:MAG: hypothetical protein J5732_06475 [Bacteroidaceae bacterium]|nr:hypothetical protein [Bacteroidaceae bacterium]